MIAQAASTADILAAEDLRALAWLHEKERPREVLAELHRSGFPQTISLLSPQHTAVTQMAAVLTALATTAKEDDPRCTDDLAGRLCRHLPYPFVAGSTLRVGLA
jgi:hypothetical protein